MKGTGFNQWNDAGGTAWLKTQAPVTGGEELTIRFAIWDTGDDNFDSTVLIDDFQWIATKGKLSLTENDAQFYNVECGVYDGFIHPVFPGDAPTGAPATGPETDPYDRSEALTKETGREGCGTVTRT